MMNRRSLFSFFAGLAAVIGGARAKPSFPLALLGTEVEGGTLYSYDDDAEMMFRRMPSYFAAHNGSIYICYPDGRNVCATPGAHQ